MLEASMVTTNDDKDEEEYWMMEDGRQRGRRDSAPKD